MADPSQLDDLPEDVWNYWHALSIVDDWGMDPVAAISANLHNSMMVLAAKMGGPVGKKDFKETGDFVRRFRWERKAKQHPLMQPGDEQFDALKRACGL